MPEVIVKADADARDGEAIVMREQVSDRNFESRHYAEQLAERIGWAVRDAASVERGEDSERIG